MTLAPADPDHLTQRELEQALWAAANALRGPVDPGDFKAYVFPVLFYKWISDVYDFRHEQAIADLGDDWTQEIEDEDYQTFRVPDGAHWDDTYQVTKKPGAVLNRALVAIQEANPGKLAGVFGDVNWANTERIPESALTHFCGEPDAAAQAKRIDASRPESSVRDVFRFMQRRVVCGMFSINSCRSYPAHSQRQ